MGMDMDGKIRMCFSDGTDEPKNSEDLSAFLQKIYENLQSGSFGLEQTCHILDT